METQSVLSRQTLLRRSESRCFSIVGFVVIFAIILIFFLAVAFVFLFVLFLVGLLANEDIGRYPRRGLARIFGLAFVSVELLLKTPLRIGSSPERTHWNFKFPAA